MRDGYVRRRHFLTLAGLVAAPKLAAEPLACQPRPSTRARQPLLIQGKQALFQRVITRPGATLAAQPGANEGRPVPALSVFYVYARQGGDVGWLEVGHANNHAEGWILAARAVDWEHAMIAAFTNPAGRPPTCPAPT
jgi:serine/threonine-protein kinase PpkA